MSSSKEDTWDDITQPSVGVPKARVLVADDDADMRELVTERLVSSGYYVREAESGSDVVRLMESIGVDRKLDAVDILVIDNRMPGITGLEAIRRLRARDWQRPAILMTAFPEDDVKREAALLGVPILPKPFSPELLTTAVLLSLLAGPETSK